MSTLTALRTRAHERVSFGAHTDLNLLPEKFRKQIKDAVPYHICNVDPETNETIITFTASILKEGEESPVWEAGAFQLVMHADGSRIMALRKHESSMTGGPDESPYLSRSIPNGPFYGAYVDDDNKPKFNFALEFRATNILKGFDRPIEGDVHFRKAAIEGGASIGRYTDLDKEGNRWWTSVPYEQRAEDTQNKPPFNNISAVFGPMGQKLNLFAESADESKLTVAPLGKLTSDQKLTLSPAPHSGPREIIETKVNLRDGDSRATLKPKKATLDVDLMPLRKVAVSFYFYQHPYEADTDLPAQFMSPTAILAKLNEVYQQARILFVRHPQNTDAEANAPVSYDGNGNGVLDAPPIMVNTSEFQTHVLNKTMRPFVNLVIVRKLSGSNDLGLTKPDNLTRSVVPTFPFEEPNTAGYTFNDFLLTCAHEIGHQLRLSVHDDGQTDDRLTHDQKAFPLRYYYLSGAPVEPKDWEKYEADNAPGSPKRRLIFGVMSQGSGPGDFRWLRREDAKTANRQAGDFGKKLEIP